MREKYPRPEESSIGPVAHNRSAHSPRPSHPGQRHIHVSSPSSSFKRIFSDPGQKNAKRRFSYISAFLLSLYMPIAAIGGRPTSAYYPSMCASAGRPGDVKKEKKTAKGDECVFMRCACWQRREEE